jgi:hypothetical protein
MTRWAVLVPSVVFLAVAGCSSGSSTTAATTTTTTRAASAPAVADPTPWLLTLQDLPTGWSVGTASDSKAGICNGPELSKVASTNGGRSATAYFKKGNSDVLNQGTYAFATPETADKVIDAITAQAHSCKSWTRHVDGRDFTATPGDLSFPTSGDRTYAFHVDVKTGDTTVGGDYVFVREGANVTAVARVGLFSDTDELQEFVQTAQAKLPA